MRKRCIKCGKVKAVSKFKRRSGRPGSLRSECKPCMRAAAKPWKVLNDRARRRRKNPKCAAVAERRAAMHAIQNTPFVCWLKRTIKAKYKHKRTCTLSVAWIAAQAKLTHCPITGMPFAVGAKSVNGAPDPLSPSLDRIDPRDGYTDENTRIISYFANVAKNAWSDTQFQMLIHVTSNNLRRH